MLRMRRPLWIILFLLAPGCHRTDGLARVEVRGSVNYQGSPVAHGLVTFRPAKGSSGPATGSAVLNGAFLIPADKGPTTGPHEVEVKIVDFAPDSRKTDEATKMNHGITQLNTFYEHVEVSNGVNQFDFSFPTITPPGRH